MRSCSLVWIINLKLLYSLTVILNMKITDSVKNYHIDVLNKMLNMLIQVLPLLFKKKRKKN